MFDQATDRRVEKFTESVSFDRRLYAHDIGGSIAHAHMLAKVGVLTDDEWHQIVTGLEQIGQEIDAGDFAFREELEDIHMNIERALIDRIGDVGRKLHTGRSRNDQVSTDLRLWVRDADRRRSAPAGRSCSGRSSAGPSATPASSCPATPTCSGPSRCWPPTTGWPTAKSSSATASGWPIAAAASTSCRWARRRWPARRMPIDRHMVADELGFDGVAGQQPRRVERPRLRRSSSPSAWRMIAEHLSSWAEEWILWSTTEFGFLKLPQAFCTGSSIMPQKINPDVLELIRGKTARVIGNLTSAAGAREGPAAGLQPRPAGRQGAAVRLVRHGARRAWSWPRRWWPGRS